MRCMSLLANDRGGGGGFGDAMERYSSDVREYTEAHYFKYTCIEQTIAGKIRDNVDNKHGE